MCGTVIGISRRRIEPCSEQPSKGALMTIMDASIERLTPDCVTA